MSIKAAVAQDIVDSIINDVKEQTEQINNSLMQMLEKSVADYRLERESVVDSKISQFKEEHDKDALRIESELRYQVSQKLRDKRSELYDAFNQELRADVIKFLNSDAYPKYLNTIIEKYGEEGNVIGVREQDKHLIEHDVPIKVMNLEMGGLMIESQTMVQDFSLASRYKEALQKFIAKSNVNI